MLLTRKMSMKVERHARVRSAAEDDSRGLQYFRNVAIIAGRVRATTQTRTAFHAHMTSCRSCVYRVASTLGRPVEVRGLAVVSCGDHMPRRVRVVVGHVVRCGDEMR